MKTRNLIIGSLLSFSSLQLQAQEDKSLTPNSTLQEVTISASRSETKQDDLPQQVQVINQQEIKQTGAQNITDVLKKHAGVDVIQYPGLLSGIGIRGFRPQTFGVNQRTLILIDGRPAGVSNLSTIDLDNVERIEVIKGAASSLYGSQAMGGVVNIITKKSDGEISKSIYASYGSYDAFEIGVQAGGKINKKLDFDLQAKNFVQNKNFRYGNDNLLRNSFGWNEVNRNYYPTTEKSDSIVTSNDVVADGKERELTRLQYQNASLRFGYQINDNWRADIGSSFFSANNVETPGDVNSIPNPDIKNLNRFSTDLKVEGKINENNRLKISIYNSQEGSDSRSTFVGVVSDYVTYKSKNSWKGVQIQDQYTVGKHKLTFGFDHNTANTLSQSFNANDGTEKAPWSPNYSISSNAIFANAQLLFLNDKLHVNAGARFDHILFNVKETPFLDTYKGSKESYQVVNPSAGTKYDITDNWSIKASAGRSFVTPHAYNVAGYAEKGSGQASDVIGSVSITKGNPNLKPEIGITVDGGINYNNKNNGLNLGVAVFNTTVKNRITTTTNSSTDIEYTNNGDTIVSTTTYINANKAKMEGLEIDLSWDLGALNNNDFSFKLFVNAVKYFSAKEIISDLLNDGKTYKKNIQNVADLSLNYGIAYSGKKFNTRLSARYVGSRFDTDWTAWPSYPEIEYAPFMTIDLAFGFPIKKNGNLNFQVNNLTDENYYEKRGFNLSGRTLQVKYTHQF